MKSPFIVKPIGWIPTVLLLSAALITGAVTSYYLVQYKGSQERSLPKLSEKLVVPRAISARGYLEPRGEVLNISAPAFIEGARVEQLLVKRGDRVKSGQVMAILDSRNRLQAALRQAEAQVKIAQSRLDQVKAGAKQGEITAQDARFQETKAELEGQLATQQATIASLEAQREGEKAAQQATIERIQAELANAQIDCHRYNVLYRDGAVAEQERDRFCLSAKTTATRLKEAEANLRRIIRTLNENINEAKANLKRTILTLDQQIKANQATLDSVEEVRPVDIEVAQAQLLSAQADVQRAQAELALASVRTPKNGQVLKIHTWPGELVGNQGILALGETNQMYVRAEVYETDISRVQVGQFAQISTDGLTGNLQGVVDEIGLQIGRQDILGTDPVADADARVVEVKIRLDPLSSEKVAGLTNLEVYVIINPSDEKNTSHETEKK
jgi:ABC exporter DevB family membrane fusion protein